MSILTKEGIQKILNDDWLLMDDCEGLENCTVIKELARMALDAMDSEPVAWILTDPEFGHSVATRAGYTLNWYRSKGWDITPLYRHAQQPVVPDDVSIFEAAIEECKTCDSIDEHAWNHGVLAVIAKYESCRAAMLAAAPQEVKGES
ncbi:TPA: hypothetical protein ACXEYH_000937 [Klebsiella pneumoniae]